jgi:putative FmdB family regulatory protein
MPIYEYQCGDCGHYLDALQKISDEPLKHCPDCGKPSLKKLLSAPRFRLKGSGWYETDFKDKNRRNLAGGDSDKPDSKKTGDKSAAAKEPKKTTGGTDAKSTSSSGAAKKAD